VHGIFHRRDHGWTERVLPRLRGFPAALALAGLLLPLTLGGCAEPPPPEEEPPPAVPLRAIVPPEPFAFLPRRGEPVGRDRQVVRGLAGWLERELRPVPMRGPGRMIEALLAGEADLVAAGLAVTDARREVVAFSVPYLHVDELLVAGPGVAVESVEDLVGLDVCVRWETGAAESLSELVEGRSGVAVRTLPPDTRVERLMTFLDRGACDAVALDSTAWAAVARDDPDLRPVYVLREDRPVAVAMRPGDEELRRRVNAYLTEEALVDRETEVATGDLPAIERRRTLRMLTRNNSMTYFIHRGRQLGFEYELLRRFASDRGLRLEIVIPPTHDDLIPWLREGRGDVIAAAMTVTPERARRVAFTRPYLEVDEVVVVRRGDPVEKLADLTGRTVHVRRSSAFYPRLVALREGVDFEIAEAPEDMETEEILARVESGEWDVAVADSNLLEAELRHGRELQAAFDLGTGRLAWAVREGNPELLAVLDGYLESQPGSRFYNVLRRKYFENQRMLERGRSDWRSDRSGRISPWDEEIKRAAARYSVDWRLLAAVMYQESRFDPDTRSWAGAVGLMQLMPATARSLGVDDLRDPRQSIRAGAEYLRWLLDRFEADLPLASRLRFALASYNVGYEHVRDARRLAARMGWSPDHWEDNVARALVLLERPEYHRQARYGYCRGRSAVAYVREVERFYRVYAEHVPREAPPGQAREGAVRPADAGPGAGAGARQDATPETRSGDRPEALPEALPDGGAGAP
jgi:membrane-bound lytic murein transglycosylase F